MRFKTYDNWPVARIQERRFQYDAFFSPSGESITLKPFLEPKSNLKQAVTQYGQFCHPNPEFRENFGAVLARDLEPARATPFV